MTAFLEVLNLGLTLDGREILHGISCSVPRGECLGVIGPNGAGKSSLLRCLGQVHRRYSGDVLLEGASLRSLSGKQIARRIAWVPQGGTDSLPFTVRQFALMSRYPWKEPFRGETTEDVRIVSRALRLAGMEPFAERPMDLLSGGERQRALIAAALAQEADILFLDEPTSFLDYRHQVETVELIGRIIRDEGRTVLLITHDINLALQCSDRILALKGGRALLQGRRDDFLNEELLSSIFETRFSFVPVPGGALPHAVPRGDFR
mgnify:CR=1 FL=1